MNHTDNKSDAYLIKAIETFKRQIIVISDDYTILASKIKSDETSMEDSNLEGKTCHLALFNSKQPCLNCPVAKVKETKTPFMNLINFDKTSGDSSCLYAYPIEIETPDKDKNAIVVLDCFPPSLDNLDEKRLVSYVFLSNLLNSAVDGVIAADMTGKIIIFNPTATEISGYTRKEALESLNIQNIYPGNDAHVIMKKMRSSEYGKKGVVKSYKQLVLRKDGTTTPILLNASIIYENNTEIATIGFFHDLKETIRMEAELEKAQTQLLQLEKMSSLGKLAAGVAHQLNNPLGSITLFSQLMLEEYKLPENAKKDLLRIKSDAERCCSIVKELLEFARQTKREVTPHNLNKIIARVLFLLRNQALFHNIEIIENYDDNIPDIPVDVQQLNHVFMNIVLNAADAMVEKGTIQISSMLKKEQGKVLIEISDSGTGIPEAVLPNIFEPFFTTKEQGKGTGLGLSMVYGIIQDHSGSITARNKNNGGTVFSIELPLKQE